MRNHSQRLKAKEVRRYIIFGAVFLLLVVNDVLLGFQVLSTVTLPVLLTTSLLLKILVFVGVINLLYRHGSLLERSEIDVLTKAFTRDVFFSNLEVLISAQGGGRTKENVSIIMFDLDNFKAINDSFGHHIGDRVLAQVATATQSVIRHNDIFARLGGEEFGIILPRTSITEAVKLAERLRSAINTSATRAYRASASFGVAMWNSEETIDQLYARADALMYKAKHEGKDRVVGE